MKGILAILMAAGLSVTLFAQGNMDNVQITSIKVTDNIYMLQGAGGNLGVIFGDDGVFMIDDQYAPMTEKIKAAVKEIANDDVRFIINTHWHFDHTGGNENFGGKAGSVIVAHDNVRVRMSKGQFMADFDQEVAPAPHKALPVVTFTTDITFHLNGETIYVYHPEPAHTDGDAIIFFKESNVVHMGDIYFSGMYPYIDVGSGGSVSGVIKAVDTVLKKVDDNTKIIPGHGPLSTKADLQKYRDTLDGIRGKVKALIKAGKSEDEAAAAKPTADWDDPWGKGFMKAERFTRIVYRSLKKEGV